MANPRQEAVDAPFTAFNFAVDIRKGEDSADLCSAAFSECDGLEMTMEVKTIREGGNNGRQIRLTGPTAYGQLTLKRGVTPNLDLWDWFSEMIGNPRLRAEADVVLLAPDGKTERARFHLSRCIPIKLKAPALNAKDGGIAIEEFQMTYETMTRHAPTVRLQDVINAVI
jgi:phage tail-like protein